MQYLIFSLGFIFVSSLMGSVFPFVYNKDINKKTTVFLNGFASGVMLAAAIWSLLVPAFEVTNNKILVIFAFLVGTLIILMLDLIPLKNRKSNEYVKKMYFAVTIHNIPEGIIVGLAVGIGLTQGNIFDAILVALAIGIQNIPESIALSTMLYHANENKMKSFLLSFVSSFVEPIFGIIAFCMIAILETSLFVFLGIAAGCMIYVVLSEMIPNTIDEEEIGGKIGLILGFIIMMFFDVFL